MSETAGVLDMLIGHTGWSTLQPEALRSAQARKPNNQQKRAASARHKPAEQMSLASGR